MVTLKKKSGSGFNEEQKRKYFKVFLRFVKINFCRSCIGSRKRIIKPLGGYERYHVVASYILVFFIYWNVYRYSICFDWV